MAPSTRDRQHVPAMELLPLGLHRNELGPTPEPHLFRDAQTLTSSRWLPRYACDPSRGGGEEPHGLHGSSCEHGNRACAYGSYCGAGRYASTRQISRGQLNGGGSILGCVLRVKTSSLRIPDNLRSAPDCSTENGEFRSSLGDEFRLRSEIAICYQRQVFSCGQVTDVATGFVQKRL